MSNDNIRYVYATTAVVIGVDPVNFNGGGGWGGSPL